MDSTFLIVGLGNIGNEYDNTRHNVGFIILDYLSRFVGTSFENKKNLFASLSNFKLNEYKIFIAKPSTYMNNSGKAISAIMSYYKIESKNVIILYDDLDLEKFKIRTSRGGGSAGHNGIKSIQQFCPKNDYIKVRIGIGRPDYKEDVSNYVLSRFSSEELNCIDTIALNICENLSSILELYKTEKFDRVAEKLNK